MSLRSKNRNITFPRSPWSMDAGSYAGRPAIFDYNGNEYPINFWSGLSGKPFITVTPNGPDDGGDYGPNTPNTTTAGIQEANDSTYESILLSSGIYEITNGILVDSNKSFISFAIRGATIKSMANITPMQNRNPSATVANNNSNIKIQGIVFDMNDLGGPAVFQSVQNFQLSDCSFINPTTFTFLLNGDAGYQVNNQCWIERNLFISNTTAYDAVDLGNGTQYSICDNIVQGVSTPSTLAEGISSAFLSESIISGNKIYNASLNCEGSWYNTYTGNELFGACAIICGAYVASSPNQVSYGNVISANIVNQSTYQSVLLEDTGISPTVYNYDNSFVANIVIGTNASNQTGFYSQHCDNGLLALNKIRDVVNFTFMDSATTNLSLFGNKLFQSSASQGGTFYFFGTATPVASNITIIGDTIRTNNAGVSPFSSPVPTLITIGIQGFNPQGFAATTPAVPASGTAQQNTNPYPVRVYLLTGGTGTAVAITDPSGTTQSITVTLAAGQEWTLDPGAKITLTYTVAPTWKWYGT